MLNSSLINCFRTLIGWYQAGFRACGFRSLVGQIPGCRQFNVWLFIRSHCQIFYLPGHAS